MRTITDANVLKQALEETGNAWLLDSRGADADRFLQQTAKEIDVFISEYERRFGEKPDPFASLKQDPLKARAFFQVDTFVVSVEMRIMIWRILLGCDIARVRFAYDFDGETSFSVTLRTPYGEEEEYYGVPGDFRVLRHFGAIRRGDQLILQGYYALK